MTETPKDNLSDGTPRLLLHGLDSLYVCYNLDLATSAIDLDDLEYRKQLARDREDAKAIIDLGGERFQVKASGRHPYRFVLTNRDFEFSLAERMHPSLKVQFYSEALWKHGAKALHDRVLAWAKAIGAVTIKAEQVIRADWAFDFDLPAIDFTEDHFVTRARKNSKWRDGQQVQTFTLGTRETVLRLYDKVAEISQASDKAWFFDLWGQDKNVWRVEFQIRGERLKQGSIRTLKELEDFQGDLLRQLATGHTTLRKPNGDSNCARWPLHPLWRALQRGIEDLPQFGLCRHYDPLNALHYRYRLQGRMLYGHLKGMGALMALTSPHKAAPSLEEVIAQLRQAVGPFHSELQWTNDVEDRLRRNELGQW